jgi:phosphoribosylglycinamide formyltransferase-1
MYNVAVLSSTRGTNFQSLIDAKKYGVIKDNVEICCLIVNKSDCGAVEKAKAAGIPCHFVDPTGKSREEFDTEVMIILDRYNVDLVVLGGYMRIVSRPMVNQYKNRIINVHPSLLPQFGGGMNLNVHKAVLEAHEKETGMTIHMVDESIDSGAIVLQRSCKVDPSDTPETLRNKVQALEKEWYPKAVQMFADGKIKVEGERIVINK